MDDRNASSGDYVTRTVTAVVGWDASAAGIKPMTLDRHLVMDGSRIAAVCADAVHAERIAALLNEHGLVDLEQVTP